MIARARRLDPIAIAWALLVLAYVVWCGCFIAQSSVIGPDGRRYFVLLDDAMISMRYARNFAHGLGLVWNAGERIEGYSNFAMTMAMALPHLVFDDRYAVLSVQLAGIALCLGTAHSARRLGALVSGERSDLFALCCGAIALAYYPLSYWSLMGMETGLLTLLVTRAVERTLRWTIRGERGAPWHLPALFAAIALARPEAVLLVVALVVHLAMRVEDEPRRRARVLFTVVALTAAPIAAHLIFRRIYYREWVPNTAFLKLTGMPLGARLRNGVGFLTPFAWQAKWMIAVLAIGTIVRRRTPARTLVLALFAIVVGYQLSVGGDPWSYWRILVPVLPATFCVAIADCAQLLRRPLATRPALLALPTLALAASLDRSFAREILLTPNQYIRSVKEHVVLALTLDPILHRGASIGVIWAGALPYYLPGRRGIDFLGKSDKVIARLPTSWRSGLGWNGMTSVPGHNKYDLRYSILELRPTYVESVRWLDQDVTAEARAIYVDAEIGRFHVTLRRDAPEVDWTKIDRVRPL